jgi:hypothetical protein
MQTAAPRIQNKTHYSPSALHCTGTRTHGHIQNLFQNNTNEKKNLYGKLLVSLGQNSGFGFGTCPRLVFQERMHLETECLGLQVAGSEDTYYD